MSQHVIGNPFSGYGVPASQSSGQPQSGPLPGNHAQFQGGGPNDISHRLAVQNGAQVLNIPAYPPTLQIIQGRQYIPKTRSVIIGGDGITAANSDTLSQLQFFSPALIWGWTGSSLLYNGSGSVVAIPVGYQPNDLYEIGVQFSAGSTAPLNIGAQGTTTGRFQASTLLGTGQLIYMFAGQGLLVDNGWQLTVNGKTYVDNLRATVTFHYLEEYRG